MTARFAKESPPLESDPFLEEGPHGPWLIPAQTATIVTPDRPFDHRELDAHRQDQDRIGRWREFTITTNSLGFRGPEPETPKRRPRVLALGESVSMGWGVQDTENWTAWVATDLDIEILNVGIPDVEPRALADWCVAEGPRLDVDVLVWTRRIGGEEPTPDAYMSHLSRCVVALQVPVLLVFPPLSRFDRLGRFNDEADRTALQAQMPWP